MLKSLLKNKCSIIIVFILVMTGCSRNVRIEQTDTIEEVERQTITTVYTPAGRVASITHNVENTVTKTAAVETEKSANPKKSNAGRIWFFAIALLVGVGVVVRLKI